MTLVVAARRPSPQIGESAPAELDRNVATRLLRRLLRLVLEGRLATVDSDTSTTSAAAAAACRLARAVGALRVDRSRR